MHGYEDLPTYEKFAKSIVEKKGRFRAFVDYMTPWFAFSTIPGYTYKRAKKRVGFTEETGDNFINYSVELIKGLFWLNILVNNL